MALEGWRVLRAGDGQGFLLGVDFTQARVRAQATFADLATGLPGELTVLGTDETGWPAADGDPGQHLAEWLARSAVPGVDGIVAAVLGFCAGAALATALAEHLGRLRGNVPALVLLNPVAVDLSTLTGQFETSLAGMARMASPADLDAARAGARDDAGRAADARELATALSRRYEALARPVCSAQGVPPSIAGQLCRRVETNLRYLATCAAAGLPGRADALVVRSRDHAVPDGVRAARTLTVDTGHDGLLADPATAREVATVVTAAAATAAAAAAPLAGRA